MNEPKTTADQNRDEINAAYVEAHAFVIHYLDEIDGRIRDLPAPESDGLDWGHVGTMNKVKRDLRAIVTFLAGYDELGD
jgi:hypothetical protein